MTLGLMVAAVSFTCRLVVESEVLSGPVSEASVNPGINESYLAPDLDPSKWVERFEREGREVYDHRLRIVETLGLRPGMRVADIGAGTGLFSRLIAKQVGEGGTVFAVDLVPAFVDLIRKRAQADGLAQIKPVLCDERSVNLTEHSIDVAFLCDVYHHFEFPKSSLASIHKALRPGGEFVLVEFRRVPGESSDWVLNHVRAGQDQFTEEIQQAGFEVVSQVDWLTENYLVRFRKR